MAAVTGPTRGQLRALRRRMREAVEQVLAEIEELCACPDGARSVLYGSGALESYVFLAADLSGICGDIDTGAAAKWLHA